jgi:hypothetical protein
VAPLLARRYVRRDQGRRVELIAAYLRRGATAGEEGDVARRVRSITFVAWREGASIEPLAPQRALRAHAEESLMRAAILIARRGAGPLRRSGMLSRRGHQVGDGSPASRSASP